MIYLFIDTNVSLHFTSFDQYPWRKTIKDDEEIIIVVTLPLIDELEKKKYNAKNHIKDRALKILRLIEQFEGQNLPNNCTLTIYTENITKSLVESLNLDNSDGDDRILASIVAFRNNDLTKKIILITNDLGPRLKARKFDIECRIPESKYQLSNDDEQDRQIRQLKKENEQLKNLTPKLSLTTENRQTVVSYKFIRYSENKDKFIADKMARLKIAYPQLKLESEEAEQSDAQSNLDKIYRFGLLASGKFRHASDEEKKNYNSELLLFYLDYEEYLKRLFEFNIKKSLTLEVKLELYNDGTIPADDIDIYCHFPDGFTLYDIDDYPAEPEKPESPNNPTERLNIGSIIPNLNFGRDYSNFLNSQVIIPNASSPVIKKTNSYDVEFNVTKVKHNQNEKLNSLYVLFESFDSIINFTVDYKIKCSNVPQIIQGEIHFKIGKEMADEI